MNFKHVSVLLDECIENLNIKPNGIYVDGTLGGGGHSAEILQRLNAKGLLIGIDQDENAIEAASEKLKAYEGPFRAIRSNFSRLPQVLEELGIDQIDGLLLDLGVSSHQLDEAERGFSYMQNAPLDMRMDNRSSLSAWEVVNRYEEAELERIIKEYGEERWAKRIAGFIVNHRQQASIEDTYTLVEIIKKAIPKGARMDGPHPAKRTFQAIRIEVNGELDIIEETIVKTVPYLREEGRICIITFHSLEDRIVKNTFKQLQNPCTCPPQFPVCQCGKERQLTVVTRKPILPSKEELEANPRSRSAKLRVAEKW